MKIFGRNKESLVIQRIRATRAVFVNEDVQEVHIDFITNTGERLVLQLNPKMVPSLIGELTDSYEAINPPLSHRRNWTAGWDGAE